MPSTESDTALARCLRVWLWEYPSFGCSLSPLHNDPVTIYEIAVPPSWTLIQDKIHGVVLRDGFNTVYSPEALLNAAQVNVGGPGPMIVHSERYRWHET